MWGLLALASAIWMAIDSARIGYDKRDIDGLAAIGPAGWFFGGLFLWIVAVPLYLVKRPTLIAAAQRRRLQMQQFAGVLPGQVAPPYGAYPPNYPGAPNPYGPPPPGGGPYGAPAPGPYGAPAPGPYGAPAPGPYGAPPAPYPPAPGQPPPVAQPPAPAAGYPASAPPNPPPGAPDPALHPSSSSSMNAADLSEGIRKLTDLRDRGLLTEPEFQARKMQLLNRL